MSLPTIRHSNGLIYLPAAKEAIAKARTLSEVKKIRDMAEAARMLAESVGMALDVQLDAAEVKVLAEHKAGEMLRAMDPKPGRIKKGSLREPFSSLGIKKTQAHRWQTVAKGMNLKQLEAHIERCRKDGRLTSRSVLRAVQRKQTRDPGPLPEGTFRTIYADPPWQYDNTGFDQSAQNAYSGMTIEQLCAMPIKEKAAPNSVLFLWVTTPMSVAAVELLRAWGFSFRSKIYWVKPKSPAMGFWVLGRVEELWIAVNGKPQPPKDPQDNVITAPVTTHSKKPDLYSAIEAIGTGPYLELFARKAEPRKGWDFWGDQS